MALKKHFQQRDRRLSWSVPSSAGAGASAAVSSSVPRKRIRPQSISTSKQNKAKRFKVNPEYKFS